MNLVAATPHRLALIAAATAIVGADLFTAGCSSNAKESPAPSTTSVAPSTTSSAPAVAPTEKTGPAPVPTLNDRGGMDSVTCGPGKTKVNGICVPA